MTPTLTLPADSAVIWDHLEALASATAAADCESLRTVTVLHGRLVRYQPGKTAVPYDSIDQLISLGWVELVPAIEADGAFVYQVTVGGKYQLGKWRNRVWKLYNRGQRTGGRK